MAIEQKEIERIKDDIETKIEELKTVKNTHIRTGSFIQADIIKGHIDGMEYCLAVFRSVK